MNRKQKKSNQVFFIALAMSLSFCASAATTFAECDDMSAMMAEGISYECRQSNQKTVIAKEENSLNMASLMAEEMPFEKIAAASTGEKNINLNHSLLLAEGPEDCYCEGPSYSMEVNMIANYKRETLRIQPAAGNSK